MNPTGDNNMVIHKRPSILDTDLKTHPISTLEEIVDRFPIKYLTTRSYEETEYGSGYRDLVTKRLLIEPRWRDRLVELIEDAEDEGHDIVIDSMVVVRDGYNNFDPSCKYHLGLIDFDVNSKLVTPDRLVQELSREYHVEADTGNVKISFEAQTKIDPVKTLHLYSSGRSYHGYVVDRLFTLEQLRVFMAQLLVVPVMTTGSDVADARWVGYRLLEGSGALRLSAVSERYLQLPARVIGNYEPETPF